MPRPGPRRPLVNFRLDEPTITAVDTRATTERLVDRHGDPNRSEILRRLVGYALHHMPAGWTPDDHG
jgi:hypothetical protein